MKNEETVAVDEDIRASAFTDEPEPSTLYSIGESDSKHGWLVTAAGFLCIFTTFGVQFSWGVMQDFYLKTQFSHIQAASVQLSFVSNITGMVTFGFVIFSRMLELRIGVRGAQMVGMTMMIGGLMAASLATRIWQFYLAIGVCSGVGSAIFYSISMRVVPEWFERRRSTAMAIMTGSASLSGLVLPPLMTFTNGKMGPAWTFRIIAFGFLGILIISCIFLKERYPKMQAAQGSTKQGFKFAVLKNTNFILWCMASFPQVFVLYMPYTFIPSYAAHIGLTAAEGSTVVSIACGLCFLGRVCAGLLGDKIGNINTNIIFMFITSLSSFFIWMFAWDYQTLLGFGIVYGFFGGAYFPLNGPITAQILGLDMYTSGFAVVSLATSPAIFGPSISSAFEFISKADPFMVYKLVGGIAPATAVTVTLILKLKMSNGRIFTKI